MDRGSPGGSEARFEAYVEGLFTPVTDPELPPIRAEHHLLNSIAIMRRGLIVALARHAPVQTDKAPNFA